MATECMLVGNPGSLLYGDVSVMIIPLETYYSTFLFLLHSRTAKHFLVDLFLLVGLPL